MTPKYKEKLLPSTFTLIKPKGKRNYCFVKKIGNKNERTNSKARR